MNKHFLTFATFIFGLNLVSTYQHLNCKQELCLLNTDLPGLHLAYILTTGNQILVDNNECLTDAL